jgi:N6-adenosine-specific RNA methylase IME4
MSEGSLAIFTKAAKMLAEADTIQKTKELKNMALTAAEWAKRKGMGEEAILYARSYALEAERKMGAMLAATDRAINKPGPGRGKAGQQALPALSDSPPTLAELGISKNDSSNAQRLAEIPRTVFEEIKAGKKTRTQVQREIVRARVTKQAALPSEKFRVIYADPPWKYGDSREALDGTTGASAHYSSMTITELCALPVIEMAQENAVLFLWVTSPILPECFQVISAWGFKYKASFVWDKVKHNMGHYNSVRHEFLLICTRGSCLPDIPKLFDSVVSVERTEKHSEKPEEFRTIIDTLYPKGKRIELFARTKAKNWEAYGNQV